MIRFPGKKSCYPQKFFSENLVTNRKNDRKVLLIHRISTEINRTIFPYLIGGRKWGEYPNPVGR
jgi:hypothetical protein